MTGEERRLLDASIDKVLVLTLKNGERLLAQILVIVDDGPTPDLFCVEVDPIDQTPLANAGHSILLSEIASVGPAPAPGSASTVPN